MHALKPEGEASKMLEEALQQMDGIISNSTISSAGQNDAVLTLSERNLISANNVISTAKTLALALQQVGVAAPAPDPVTAAIISDWLEIYIRRQSSDERFLRLQRDKESLALQYKMLAERVSEQADKIIELEGTLTEKNQQLSIKEEQLQRQIILRSALETQKLELMTALSELKLHRVALERDSVEMHKDNGNIVNLQLLFGSVGDLNQTNHLSTPKTPPTLTRHHIRPQFHSLPRSHGGVVKELNKPKSNNYNNNNNRILDANSSNFKQRNVVFASNEMIVIGDNTTEEHQHTESMDELMNSSFISQTNSSPSPNLRERSAKGFRNILGKLRRSNSGNIEIPGLEQSDPEFRRGGARATTGGRIEWTTQSIQRAYEIKNYKDWSAQEVCNWLIDMGLGCYEDACRKWLKTNPNISFFTVSPIDIERELNLKIPLHRKKIMLALDELTCKETDELTLKASQLDTSWVMRWLDDIGLPQYKDHFLQAKIDGRMLHRLTLEDLAQLQVSSCLHIASIRCAIQCMREVNWNSDSLIRRSINNAKIHTDGVTDVSTEAVDKKNSECVALWTTHRVMEWLRIADLSEYAPNLRGAGVHGSLMLYEQRFNAELLADLLSIPPSKSLLRRHLATHFKELLGRSVIQGKRDAEAEPGYQPLTTTAKLKPLKKSQFSLKRRKSHKGPADVEWTDYVCPITATSDAVCNFESKNVKNAFVSSKTSSTDFSSLVSSL